MDHLIASLTGVYGNVCNAGTVSPISSDIGVMVTANVSISTLRWVPPARTYGGENVVQYSFLTSVSPVSYGFGFTKW